MALFGDLGKALGLGSGKDLLPLIGTAAGFYFAPALGMSGAMGAAAGSGLGSLAGGKSVNDALKNAALSYGVTSFLSPSATNSLQMSGGQGSPNSFLQNSLYAPTTGIDASQVAGSFGSTPSDMGSGVKITDLTESDGMFGGLMDFAKDNKMLTAGLGIAGLGALSSPEEQETRNPDYGRRGEAWDVEYRGIRYDLDNPEESDAYNARKAADREEFRDKEVVSKANGGAMYGQDKMSYDTPITGEVSGPGTGTSDSVPARLSDGEFVLTANAVRGAGGGDRDVGAARLYDMMADLEATA